MRTDLFTPMLERLLGREGGYANNPADAGGETMWGVTAAVARAQGYAGAMRDMSRDQALDIYRGQYVTPGLCNVAVLSPAIAEELFDTSVNMGVCTAATLLQRALNVLNRRAADYPDVTADGRLGPSTLAALQAFLRLRGKAGEMVLLKALNCLQGARYVELAESRAANETFEYGWLAQRVGLAA